MAKLWRSFRCPSSELNLNIVLACGQSFRWSKFSQDEWAGVAGKRLWILKQDDDSIFFKSYGNVIDKENHSQQVSDNDNARPIGTSTSPLTTKDAEDQDELPALSESDLGVVEDGKLKDDAEEEEHVLKDYFQLNITLENLYKQWSLADKNFFTLSSNFDGGRMLRQDPVENLFSFICSQNNHISRISSMVEKLCVNYGDEICELEGKKYYSFPTLLALSDDTVEDKLRELGFGYRAKFINQCARFILEKHSNKWLYELRNVPYKEAHKALCELPGVGSKVADCVCLMSLDKTEAIPVDTHMWQIAQRDYLPHLKKYKTLTDKIYQEIGDHFRSIYGDFAGWAHSVLFSADLRRFKDLKEATKESSSRNETHKTAEQSAKSTKKYKVLTGKSDKVLKRKSQRLADSSKGIKHSKR